MPTDDPRPESPARTTTTRPRPGRLLAAGAGILAFGLLVGVLLSQALRPRLGQDDVITGGAVPSTSAPAPSARAPAEVVPEGHPDTTAGPSDAELDRLAKQAEAAPADIDAQLSLVRAAMDADRGDLALPALGRILDRDPAHPAALTYLGLMTAAEGRYEQGLELIDQALAAAPGDTFALWAKGGLLFSHRQDYAGAAAAWETMLRSPRLDATTRAAVEEWVAEARWRQEHGGEVERPRGSQASRPPAAPIISGTVTLGPGVTGGATQAGALFVIARRGSGPPLAVKRIESPRFPVTYTLGPEDAMLRDRAVEGDLEIVARLSRSGAAGPARPGDLEGRFPRNPVRPGAANVDIVLVPVAPDAVTGTPPASR